MARNPRPNPTAASLPLWRIEGISRTGHPFTRKVRAEDYQRAEIRARESRPARVLVIALDSGTPEQRAQMRAQASAAYTAFINR